MLKFVNTAIVFREIPNEVTLAINMSGCPYKCKGCHSSYLRKDIGTILTDDRLLKLIQDNEGITCVAIMGGDADPPYVNHLGASIHSFNLLSAWYSGNTKFSPYVNYKNFDYVKIGPYIEELGGLDKSTTNQRLYKITENEVTDITSTLWN